MLKRKARIVFFSQQQPEMAHAAQQLLNELNSPNCEARSGHNESALTSLSQWADTIIFINDAARATPATSKIWSVATQADLETQIAGLLGGLKLLQRLADDD